MQHPRTIIELWNEIPNDLSKCNTSLERDMVNIINKKEIKTLAEETLKQRNLSTRELHIARQCGLNR